MKNEFLWLLGLLLTAVVLFITGKVRMDVVAIGHCCLCAEQDADAG